MTWLQYVDTDGYPAWLAPPSTRAGEVCWFNAQVYNAQDPPSEPPSFRWHVMFCAATGNPIRIEAHGVDGSVDRAKRLAEAAIEALRAGFANWG